MDALDSPGQRLRWARERDKRFATATSAAEAFGWTISTYLGHENGDRNPSKGAAKKYGEAYKVPWAWILDGGPLPGKRARGGPIPTTGEVAAGLWLDVDMHNQPELEQYPIAANPKYPHDLQYGLRVRGTSMNRTALEGDVLHCLSIFGLDDVNEDDVVIVERTRAQGSQKEVTAKRVRRRGKMFVLVPDSTDSKWKPIEFDPAGRKGDEQVGVVAVVLAIYKPLKRRRA